MVALFDLALRVKGGGMNLKRLGTVAHADDETNSGEVSSSFGRTIMKDYV